MIKPQFKTMVRTTSKNDLAYPMEFWKDTSSFEHLRCGCDTFLKKYWCEHITAVMEHDKYDANSIGSTPAVPIFKTPLLIVPCLVLYDQDSAYAAVSATWGNPQKTMGQVHADGVYGIGFIRRGVQGRQTIRKLLLEWLVAIPDQFPDAMVCRQYTHTGGTCVFERDPFPQVFQQLSDQEIRRARIIDGYQLLDSKACRACAEIISIDADLPF